MDSQTVLNDNSRKVLTANDGLSITRQSPTTSETAAEREASVKDFIRVFLYAQKSDWIFLSIGVASSIGSGITMPLMNIVFGHFAGSFGSYDANGSSAVDSFLHDLNRQVLYIFILFLARFALNYISKFAFRMISVRMSAAVRLHYLRSVFSQSIHVLDSMPPGQAASTITATANTLQLGISENLGTFLESAACIIASVVVAFTFSWLLTLVITSILLFLVLALCIILPFIIYRETRVLRAETHANAIAAESFANVRMLLACGAASRIGHRYGSWVQEARYHGLRMAPAFGTLFGTLFLSLHGAFALAFWFGLRVYHQRRISGGVGTIIIVLMSMITMIMSLERLTTPLISASKAMVAAAEFFAVIDAPRPPHGKDLKAPEVSAVGGDIVFSGVDFAYPGRPNVKVLDGLNMRIEAGKVNAIVGPSGSGKSTIIGLVERWYSLLPEGQHVIARTVQKDKEAGQIQKLEEEEAKKMEIRKRKKQKKEQRELKRRGVSDKLGNGDPVQDKARESSLQPVSLHGNENNGLDHSRVPLRGSVSIYSRGDSVLHEQCNLEDIDVRWWRSQIGVVLQEPFLFNDTIFNNVAFGLVGSLHENASPSEKQALVKKACQEAFADEFIDRLPDGYETLVGDAGAKLSGGQRQRVAIARSIVKDPAILILDEATSAIDVRSERIVQAALDQVSHNRTTITVAHRLSTIKAADKIFVLKRGRCIEEGTHDSLLTRTGGVYRQLVEAQQLELEDYDDRDRIGINDDHISNGHGEKDEKLAEEDVVTGASASLTSEAGAWKDKGLFGSFGRLLFEQRSQFPLYFFMLASSMAVSSAAPLQAFLFAKLVTIFGGLALAEQPEYTNILSLDNILHDGNFYALMFFVLALGTGTAYFALGTPSVLLEHRVYAIFREQYFNSLLQQRASFFDQAANSAGSLTSRIGGDPKQLRELLGPNLSLCLSGIFTVFGSMAISFAYGWKLALVALAVIMPLMLASGFYRVRYEIEFEKMTAAVFTESSRWAAESLDASRTVAALTLEDVICQRYEKLLAGHVNDAYLQARFKTILFALSNSISLACQALIFWYGGRLMSTGEYSVTAFFVCYMAVIQGSESAGTSLAFLPNAAQTSGAANRILSTRMTRNQDPVPFNEKIPDTDENAGIKGVQIKLRDICFQYPTRNVPIFSGLNLTIESGQFAAIVGASGSGKTTIISLLERFYEPQSGQILFNGRDITEVNVQTYRRLLSLVAQESALFQGTVRENVLLGIEETEQGVRGVKDHDNDLEERMVQACRDASIHDFIMSLPQGYDTDLGSRGVALSGGQKQRISIARALVRNPRVLLLDEATSSLDSETERLIQATFERVARGRTTVAVAHRLSTIQHADVIYVLGEGHVLERGNHAELLRKRGIYFSMCQSQALDS